MPVRRPLSQAWPGTRLRRRRDQACPPESCSGQWAHQSLSHRFEGEGVANLALIRSRIYGARPHKRPHKMSGVGLVSRASPVQTAVRNCTRDEGGPFGFGDQVADPKPPQAAVVKSHGGERCGNAGTMIPEGTVERGERKRTVSEVSKAD